MSAAKIKKGDKIVVLAGKDKGRTGAVLQVMPKADKVLVEGINVHAKHRKPDQSNPQGGIERKPAPLHISNVAVADKDVSLVLTGNGDVLEPEDGLIGIGSGGNYALAAARALIGQKGLSAEDIAKKALKVAAEICVYTNENVTIETL